MAWYRRCWNLFRPNRLQNDLERELRFHMTERMEELQQRGLTPSEARQTATQQFGSFTHELERTRDMDTHALLEALARNLKYSLRSLRKTPAFTATVILTLAAGTGYNVIAPNSATGTITNDDIVVSVAVSPGAVDEDGATNLVYTFTRNDSNGPLTANFSIGGTATFNTDYTQTGADSFAPPNGTVTFANGSLTATVTIDPVADSSVEPDETVIPEVMVLPMRETSWP